MIKTVTINSVLTPGGNLALAETIVGKTIEPQLRWSPGSLANSALSAAAVPLLIMITGGALVAVDNSAATDIGLSLTDFETFSADVMPSKSKTISCSVITYPALALTVAGAAEWGIGHPVYQVFKPEKPTFTLLSLVNALETALIANGDTGYLIVVDQVTEKVFVQLLSDETAATARIGELLTGDLATQEVIAAFNTVADPTSSSTPSYGWE